MSSPEETAHLSNHHRTTLRQIFQHPVSHNIEWRSVLSLLETAGTVTEHHDGKIAVTLGDDTQYFDPPPHKDVDVQMVVDLRHMLANAGFGPEGAGSEAAGAESAGS
jgi:hypothetical protein